MLSLNNTAFERQGRGKDPHFIIKMKNKIKFVIAIVIVVSIIVFSIMNSGCPNGYVMAEDYSCVIDTFWNN